MADIVDIAGERMDIELERAVAARVTFSGESAIECRECGAELPQLRRSALPGVRLCVACAEVAERSGRGSRG